MATQIRLFVLLSLCILCFPSNAFAVGEASTLFNIYVPPNNDNNGRDIFLIVTAVNGSGGDITTVQIVDDGADGDTDDTHSNVQLTRGQSYLVRLKDGATNDDAGGKADGDYFKISSDRPVLVQMSTKSNWQHDWVPADNKTMKGRNFFLYSPPSSGAAGDLNVYAYENNTTVVVHDITVTPKSTTGATSVSFSSSSKILEVVLNEGEDLISHLNVGTDILEPGRTYYIQTTRAVTAQYGHLSGLSSGSNHSRDGGGFVPSSSGASVGDKFYFRIAHNNGNENEKELRIISYDNNNTVNLYGWGTSSNSWELISSQLLNQQNYADFVGATNATFKAYTRYKITCSTGKRVAVFEANWLETGATGTSDVASSVSSDTGHGAGTLFITYVGPPGYQNNTTQGGRYAHVFVYGHEAGTVVSGVDAVTGGTYFSQTCNLGADQYCDIKLDINDWNTLNSNGRRPYIKITSNKPVAVMMTNWNDNWMTYATSVLVATPKVTASVANPKVVCGNQVTISASVDNFGTADLTSAKTTVTLPEGLTYVSSSGDLGSNPTVTTPNNTTRLTFSGYTHTAGTVKSISIVATVTCQKSGGGYFASGTIVSVPIVGEGLHNGDTYATQDSQPIQFERNNFISAISARNGGSKVIVAWQTTVETNNTGFAIYRSTHPVNNFVQINPTLVASGGDTSFGHSYTYADTTTTNGTQYFYKVELRPSADPYVDKGPVSATPTNDTPPQTPTATAVAGVSLVKLTYSVIDPTNVKGYIIRRSTSPTGPFVAIHSGIRTAQSYLDLDVLNGITYYYQVTAVSNSDLHSDPSSTVNATPTGAQADAEHIVAYEDAMGTGTNDWDYNDFVARLKTHFTINGSNNVSQIEITIEALARGASFSHEYWMKIPNLIGHKSYTLKLYDGLNGTLLSTTTGATTEDINVQIWSDTKVVLPAQATGQNVFATNTSSDKSTHVNGHVAVLTVTISTPASNPFANMPAAPFDAYLKISKLTGEPEIHRSSYCSLCQETVDTPNYSPGALYSQSHMFGANLDFTITIPKNDTNFWRWSTENTPIWHSYPTFTENYADLNWYLSPTTSLTWGHYTAP